MSHPKQNPICLPHHHGTLLSSLGQSSKCLYSLYLLRCLYNMENCKTTNSFIAHAVFADFLIILGNYFSVYLTLPQKPAWTKNNLHVVWCNLYSHQILQLSIRNLFLIFGHHNLLPPPPKFSSQKTQQNTTQWSYYQLAGVIHILLRVFQLERKSLCFHCRRYSKEAQKKAFSVVQVARRN